MSATIIEAIQMPAGVMPPADAVYEVSATPFQATAVGMLFIDTSMKLHKAKELADKVGTLDTEIDAAKKRGRQWSDELDHERKAPPKRAYNKAMKLLDFEEPVAAADDE